MGRSRNETINKEMQVDIHPNIGLDGDARREVVKILSHTLTNESVLTVKTRIAHWNVSGKGFFEKRALLDSQYEKLNQISENIAERVRVLGGIAVVGLQEFLEYTRQDELRKDTPDIADLLSDHEATIRLLREDAKKCSEEFGDEVTRHFLVDILYQHEKMAWRLRSYIEA